MLLKLGLAALAAAEGAQRTPEDPDHEHGGEGEPDGEEVERRDRPDEVADEEEGRPPDRGEGDEQGGGEEAGPACGAVGPVGVVGVVGGFGGAHRCVRRDQTMVSVIVVPLRTIVPALGSDPRTVPKNPPRISL